MKKLKLWSDTSSGTGKVHCKYGALSPDVVVAMLGKGASTPVYLPGAGHHSTVTTWSVDNPHVKGCLRRLCRDAALRSAAFYQRQKLKTLLQWKWVYGGK